MTECDDRTFEIRRFFLDPAERYSLEDLARIWRVRIDHVTAMFSDELEAARSGRRSLAFEVSATDALQAANAFQVFRPIDVEQALGEEFARVRPEHWRTIPITVYLPRFIVDGIAAFPFLPEPASLAERTERLLCELIQADRAIGGFVDRAHHDD